MGSQYRPVIFFHDDYQQERAEASKQSLAQAEIFTKPIVVAIEAASPFYKAEEKHCRYYLKNPDSYTRYKNLSGRVGFLEKIWKDK